MGANATATIPKDALLRVIFLAAMAVFAERVTCEALPQAWFVVAAVEQLLTP